MERIRIVEVPEDEVTVADFLSAPSASLFRQAPADDLGRRGALDIFRCCVCGLTHLTFDQTGIGYQHVVGNVICCALCEADVRQGGAS